MHLGFCMRVTELIQNRLIMIINPLACSCYISNSQLTLETGYDKTKELAGEIEKTVNVKEDGSISQMLIIVSISSFFTGMLFGLRGTSDRKGLKISAD
jgi:hypothetical protein